MRIARFSIAFIVGAMLCLIVAQPAGSTVRARVLRGGIRAWAARYDGAHHLSDGGRAIAASPDGDTVFVTGTSENSANVDCVTIAYNALTGERRWLARYDGEEHRNDDCAALAVSPSGLMVFVVGSTNEADPPGPEELIVAYDAATGEKQWSATYAGPAGDVRANQACCVAVTPDGTRVVVAGVGITASTFGDLITSAYDANTGERRWLKRFDGPAHQEDFANSIAVDDARVYVTGLIEVEASPGAFGVTVAYDLGNGARQWARQTSTPSQSATARAVTASPDGSLVFVAGGASRRSDHLGSVLTIAYDASTGRSVWRKNYSQPSGVLGEATDLAVSPSGDSVVVTGSSNRASDNSTDFATIAYDASTGAQAWAKRYDGPTHASSRPLAVAISPDDAHVVVTGFSGAGSAANYSTVAYALSDGSKEWPKIFDGSLHDADAAYSVAITASRAFVTGRINGGVTDIETIAYSL